MEKQKIKDNGKLLSKIFLLAVIVLLTVFIFLKLTPYLSGVLGALMFFFLFRGWMDKLVKKGVKPAISSIILIVSSVFFILIPILMVALLIYNKLSGMKDNFTQLGNVIQSKVGELESYIGYNISEHIDTSGLGAMISDNIKNLAGNTLDITVAIGLLYFLLYFMLIHRDNLSKIVRDYMPMSDESSREVYKESRDMVKANAIGIPLVAIFQGIIALIGFWIFGVPDPLFWFAVTTIASVIPFIGTALGIVPVVILMISQGHTWQGIGILLYGIIVVGSTDNFVRLAVLKKLSDIHPLLTLVGVIVGVPLFGFLGLIFGPLLISLLLLLIRIYRKEYITQDS